MSTTIAFTTRLPPDLKETLDEVCRRFGLQKRSVVEQALREKIEDLLDAHDLEEAERTAESFLTWDEVEDELRRHDKL